MSPSSSGFGLITQLKQESEDETDTVVDPLEEMQIDCGLPVRNVLFTIFLIPNPLILEMSLQYSTSDWTIDFRMSQ